MKRLKEEGEWEEVVVDGCALQARGKEGKLRNTKYKVWTNERQVAEALRTKRCKGGHVHGGTRGERRQEGIDKEMAEAIVRACEAERICGVRNLRTVAMVEGEVTGYGEEEHEECMAGYMATDDVTGEELDAKEVRKARLEEVAWMRRKGVYIKITRKEAKEKDGR